jgi:hypothetical protein
MALSVELKSNSAGTCGLGGAAWLSLITMARRLLPKPLALRRNFICVLSDGNCSTA